MDDPEEEKPPPAETGSGSEEGRFHDETIRNPETNGNASGWDFDWQADVKRLMAGLDARRKAVRP